jgi:ribose transport system permease protein
MGTTDNLNSQRKPDQTKLNRAKSNRAKFNLKNFDFSKYAPLIALVILFILSATASEHFLKFRNITNILRQVSYTGTIALGMTFVIVAGGIDLSVGSMVAFLGVLTIYLMNYLGGGPMAVCTAVLAAMVAGALCGAFNGIIVTRGKITAFIATLGTMSIFRSMTLYISEAGEVISQNEIYPEIGGGYFMNIPYPVIIFLGLAFFFHFLLNNTAFGRHVCAVGANQQVAIYSAIKVQWITFLTFVITGFTVGVTAVLLSSRLNSISPGDAGIFYELDSIAAVVIGGTPLSGGKGSIWGTVIGAIILGIINNMLNMLGISPYLQGTVKGFVILVAVLAQYKNN